MIGSTPEVAVSGDTLKIPDGYEKIDMSTLASKISSLFPKLILQITSPFKSGNNNSF